MKYTENDFLFEESAGFNPTVEWLEENYEKYRKELNWEVNLPPGLAKESKNISKGMVATYHRTKMAPPVIYLGKDIQDPGIIASAAFLPGVGNTLVSLCITFSSRFSFTSEKKCLTTLLHEMGHVAVTQLHKNKAAEYLAESRMDGLEGHGKDWQRICKSIEQQTGIPGVANRYGDSTKANDADQVENRHGDKFKTLLVRYTDPHNREVIKTYSIVDLIDNRLHLNDAYQAGRLFKAKAKYYLLNTAVSNHFGLSDRRPGDIIDSNSRAWKIVDVMFGDSDVHEPTASSQLESFIVSGEVIGPMTRNEYKEYFSEEFAEIGL
jgi:hypothetical protein